MKPRKAQGIAKTGRDTSASLYSISYVAQYITTVLGLFITSATDVFKAIGSVFPPVAYVFDGFKALFNIGIEYFKRKKTKPEEDELLTPMVAPLVKIPESTKGSAIMMAANATVLVLDVLVAVILVGALLSSPIGWTVAAVAAAVGWIADDVVPAWRAREEYKSCQQEITLLKSKLHEATSLTEKQGIKEEIKKWKIAANYTNKTSIEARNKVLMGLVAVIGMAFFACGPFGFAALGLVGSVIFVGLAVKGIGGFLYNKWISRKTNAINEFAATTAALSPNSRLAANKHHKLSHTKNVKHSIVTIKSRLPVNKMITSKREKIIDSQALKKASQLKTSVAKFGQFSSEEETREMSVTQETTLRGEAYGRRKER